ncbi:class I SAM-dependent methyltransferase [Muricauda sp. SCSIO 64092]|nr:class I SAM-dependent methyltransferase [Muricauda sp. SCSIO 64092]
MHKLLGILPILISFVSVCAQDGPYSYKKNDPNGIGKWYMGREIAHVMGFQGMYWLERPEREREEKATKLLENMQLSETDVIADIGAGSGYHVFKMAEKTPKGIIYAVDIQEEMLEALKFRKREFKAGNVEIVRGSEKNVNLPKNTLDKVLIVDVYHEMGYPMEMMRSIYNAMKKEGKLFLIEYRGEDPSVPIKRLHKMTEEQAVKEMAAVGFVLKENIDNLPWQHCMVFVKEIN